MFAPTITDPLARGYFEEAWCNLTHGKATIPEVQGAADAARLGGSYDEKCKSAFYYLAAAEKLKDNGEYKEASHTYHFAAHQMRRIEQFNQAARAYANAGEFGEMAAKKIDMKDLLDEKIKEQKFAIRSYGRAKNCYTEVGDLDASEKVYLDEQNARYALAKISRSLLDKFALGVWKHSSVYGTSVWRWCGVMILFVLAFGAAYYFLMEDGQMTLSASVDRSLFTPLFYSLMTTSTLGYGEIVPASLLAQIVLSLNIIFGYVLLGLGIGVIVRHIKSR